MSQVIIYESTLENGKQRYNITLEYRAVPSLHSAVAPFNFTVVPCLETKIGFLSSMNLKK